MTPYFQAVIFDMDGLMLDTEPLYKAAWQAAAVDFGYCITDELFHSLIGKNNTDSEAIVIQELGVDFPVVEFRELWPQKWRERVASGGIPLKPGLLELLDFLDLQTIPFGVATSSEKHEATFALSQVGIYERFRCIVTSDQVSKGKPAPDIYLKAAEELGVAPRSCIALEDSNSGATAAIHAGLTTIVVPDILPPTEEVLAASHAIEPSLKDAQRVIEKLIFS